MLIGNKYSDNRMYRGQVHENSLPLTSEDIHENSDTLQKKNAFLFNNLLGSGILNAPDFEISSSGISIKSPYVVLLDGDIILIQSDNQILKLSDINDSNVTEGVLCAVGWYQLIDSHSTERSYGGVNNAPIPNNLIDKNLSIQVSRRYQFRWDTVLINKNTFESNQNITFSMKMREASGELSYPEDHLELITSKDIGNVKIVEKPAYSVVGAYMSSDIYVVPLLEYNYSTTENRFTSLKSVNALKPKGASTFVKSTVSPEGILDEGTMWYNPTTSEFKSYIEGLGFVSMNPHLSLAHYNNTVTMSEVVEVQNIPVKIGISLTDKDILEVAYNGLLLARGTHYEISEDLTSINLLDFTTEVGDEVTFHVTRLLTKEGNPEDNGGALIIF